MDLGGGPRFIAAIVSGIATVPVGTVNLRFVMASVGPESDSAWIVTWDSVTGRTYRIYESMSIGVWTNVVHQTAGTGEQMAYTNRLTDETDGFMRVTVERD